MTTKTIMIRNIKSDERLKGQLVGVKCHFTRAYKKPFFDKKYMVRSYNAYKLKCAYASNAKNLNKYDYEKRIWDVSNVPDIKPNTIGVATGNYVVLNKTLWVEIKPLFCNRSEIAYVRGTDIDINVDAGSNGNTTETTNNNKKILNSLLLGLAVYEILN